jgi:hypothetical protein
MVTEGIEPSTVALLAQRSNQLSYATYLALSSPICSNHPTKTKQLPHSFVFSIKQFSRIIINHKTRSLIKLPINLTPTKPKKYFTFLIHFFYSPSTIIIYFSNSTLNVTNQPKNCRNQHLPSQKRQRTQSRSFLV